MSMDELVGVIKDFQENIKKSLPSINKEINYIIETNIQDAKLIEKTLDVLLDLSNFGFCDEEFLKLNSYYSTISKEASRDYDSYFRDN